MSENDERHCAGTTNIAAKSHRKKHLKREAFGRPQKTDLKYTNNIWGKCELIEQDFQQPDALNCPTNHIMQYHVYHHIHKLLVNFSLKF